MLTTSRSSDVTGAASAALELARCGFDVFPCRPNRKEPATRNGLKDATRDPGLIQGWWEQWPDANLAVRTGNGRFVVDIDPEGVPKFAGLCTTHRDDSWQDTPMAVTPRGGFHYWFTSELPVRNSASKVLPGVDVRGDGGYVLVAPSVVKNRPYEWELPLAGNAVQPAPRWLLDRIVDQPGSGTARNATDWRDLAAGGVTEGARNDSCARLAGHLLARGIDPFVTLELIVAWDQQRNRPPLGADETARVVRSIARRETERWR